MIVKKLTKSFPQGENFMVQIAPYQNLKKKFKF